jgi:hypothetical protein
MGLPESDREDGGDGGRGGGTADGREDEPIQAKDLLANIRGYLKIFGLRLIAAIQIREVFAK